jgi:hypothetical protein
MYSNITIDGEPWDVAPPLTIGFQSRFSVPDWLGKDQRRAWHGVNAREFWADAFATSSTTMELLNGSYSMQKPQIYMHNKILLDEASTINTG